VRVVSAIVSAALWLRIAPPAPPILSPPGAWPPVSVTPVPVTSWLVPPAVTTYFVIGRPLSSAGCQDTWMAPFASTVTAWTFFGALGTVNGTTVLLIGDGFEPAPLSLTATTVNAYCVP